MNIIWGLAGIIVILLIGYLLSNNRRAISPRTVFGGLANLSSVAILLGGFGGMAPTRRSNIAKFGIKSIIAGTLANLLSAAIAGMFV
ncbi:nucleoside transporter C-terminal domain-containing protein [Bacillus cereus]|uniref:nucleoside transporter C-terminal domain-containing protein n=1 Tax=Bacillus cereus TaxID=1396 RepID=UPI00356FB9F7